MLSQNYYRYVTGNLDISAEVQVFSNFNSSWHQIALFVAQVFVGLFPFELWCPKIMFSISDLDWKSENLFWSSVDSLCSRCFEIISVVVIKGMASKIVDSALVKRVHVCENIFLWKYEDDLWAVKIKICEKIRKKEDGHMSDLNNLQWGNCGCFSCWSQSLQTGVFAEIGA